MIRCSLFRPSRPGAPGLRSVGLIRPPARRGLSLLLGLLLGSLVVGCEVIEPPPPKPTGPRLYPVRGKVTIDGAPLAGAVVVFLPAFSDAGTHSVGETQADGSYELAHNGQPGAGRGDYRVVVSYLVGENGKVASLDARSAESVPPEVNRGKELVPPRYSNFSQTMLRASVEPDCPPINFDLVGHLLPPPDPPLPSHGDPITKPSEPAKEKARE